MNVKLSTPIGNLLLDYHRASENIEHVAASALRGERVELKYVKKARTDLNKLKSIQPSKSEKEQIQNLVDALDRVIRKAESNKNPARAFSLKTEVKRSRSKKAKKAASKAARASSAASTASRISLSKRISQINPNSYKDLVSGMSDEQLESEHKAVTRLIARARKSSPGVRMMHDLDQLRAAIVAEKRARRSHVIPISNPSHVKSEMAAIILAKKYSRALDRYNKVATSPGYSAKQIKNAREKLKKSQEELSVYAEINGISPNDLKKLIERS